MLKFGRFICGLTDFGLKLIDTNMKALFTTSYDHVKVNIGCWPCVIYEKLTVDQV